jgi:hypothetical protein
VAGRFIKLYEQILDWEWYGDINTFRLFIHLLLKANYADTTFQGRVIRRGQLVSSLTSIAAGTGLTIRQARDSLSKLQMTGEVTSKPIPRGRVITIVRYDDYQSSDKQNGRQMTGKTAAKRQANDTQNDKQTSRETATSIEYIEYKNNRIIENNTPSECRTAPRFQPPTKEEVYDYCLAAGLGVDVDRFHAYYTSNGWKVGKNPMKDWKAAARYWAREKKPEGAAKTVAAQRYTQRDYSGADEEALRQMLEMGGVGDGENNPGP